MLMCFGVLEFGRCFLVLVFWLCCCFCRFGSVVVSVVLVVLLLWLLWSLVLFLSFVVVGLVCGFSRVFVALWLLCFFLLLLSRLFVSLSLCLFVSLSLCHFVSLPLYDFICLSFCCCRGFPLLSWLFVASCGVLVVLVVVGCFGVFVVVVDRFLRSFVGL